MKNQPAAIQRRLSDPDYLGKLFGRSLTLNLGLGLAVAAFVAKDLYTYAHPTPPRYFRVDGQSPPRPMVALDSPIVDDTELLQWTVKAVLAPYNVNYHDYPTQLNDAGRRFSVEGWNSWASSYMRGKNLDALKTGRMLCYAVATRAPLINKPSVTAGRLTYEIQFPMVQTCQNTQQENTSNMVMVATVKRIDSPDYPDGLVVDRLVAVQR